MGKYISLLLVLILIMCISGCGDPPEKVVADYLQKLLTQDFIDAKSLCTGKALMDVGSIEMYMEQGSRGNAPSPFLNWDEVERDMEIRLLEKSKEKALVHLSIRDEEFKTITLIKKDGRWKISEGSDPLYITWCVRKMYES